MLSFTRTLGALWAVLLLDLTSRVLFNILGRLLFLEAASGSNAVAGEASTSAPPPAAPGLGASAASAAPALPPPPFPAAISADVQGQFVGQVEYLVEAGLERLLGVLSSCVNQSVQRASLKGKPTAPTLSLPAALSPLTNFWNLRL